MMITDKRGEILTDWIAQLDLCILNQGDKPTFQRQSYGSILDVSLATIDVGKKIKDWQVSDKESLSDHNYITFVVSKTPQTHAPQQKINGWNTGRLNREKLNSAINVILTTERSPSPKYFSKALRRICNECMPRKRRVNRGQPLYWWDDRMAELRCICIRKRREYTRKAKRNSADENLLRWEEYTNSKKILRNAIKEAKKACWRSIVEGIDRDIWGDGFKIVKKRLLGYPPRPQMSMQTMDHVIDHLFPLHEPVVFNCNTDTVFENFSIKELELAAKRLKNNKAPGPGNIPSEILKVVVSEKPDWVLNAYNQLATRGEFPKEWKCARVVLLKKADKDIISPRSYRPICLLDIEGKLYEHLLLGRLKSEITRTGGLAENQYGFREGRQTVDAIMEVVQAAKEAAAYSSQCRRLCVAVTIDVQNAFNSASWQIILEELRKRGVDESLIKIVRAYLSDRTILLEAEGMMKCRSVNSGVPQGSVLGPTLWNVLYNDLLLLEQPKGVKVIGFADDIVVVVAAQTEDILINSVNVVLQRISNWMEQRKLQLAPEKTEAVILSTKRKIGNLSFNLQGVEFRPSTAVRYLGVWLDTKLTYNEHVNKIVQKAEKTMSALAGLMPNIGGPRASKRRLLVSVVHSQILYAAPVWHTITNNKRILRKMTRVQRTLCIRVCSGYRTISAASAAVIAGIPPIELMVDERRQRYNCRERKEAAEDTLAKWQDIWQEERYGRWTYKLIPNIASWLSRRFGEPDYYLTQALSGHGNFRHYLYVRQRADTDECPYCSSRDDVEHTLFYCERWQELRRGFKEQIGKEFTPTDMMATLVDSEEGWQKAYHVVRSIIQTKEQEMRLM